MLHPDNEITNEIEVEKVNTDPASATDKPIMRIYGTRHQFEEDWPACTEQGLGPDYAYYY
ncbi:MAG TPA: hypothetical protein VGD33_07025 [Chitinophagaceae bacterium]